MTTTDSTTAPESPAEVGQVQRRVRPCLSNAIELERHISATTCSAKARAALDGLMAEISRLRSLLARQYRADVALYEMPNDCTEAEHVAALREHDAVHALLAAEIEAQRLR